MQDQLLIHPTASSRLVGRQYAEAALLIGFTVLVLYIARDPAYTQLVNKLVVPGTAVLTIAYARFRLFLTSEQLFFAVFALFGSLGVFFAQDPDRVVGYVEILGGILLLWVPVVHFVAQRGHFRAMMAGFALSAGLLLLSAMSAAGSIVGSDSTTRLVGDVNNPNGLAFLLLYGMMACVYLVSRAGQTRHRALLLLASTVLFVGVIGTASRKTFIVSLVFVGIYSIWRRTTWRRVLVVATATVVLLVSFDSVAELLAQNTYVGQRLRAEDLATGAETREGLVLDALRVFEESPLFGVGLGNYQVHSAYGLHSHNDVAELLSTTGLLGASLYVAMYLVFIRRLRRLARVKRSNVEREVVFLRAAFVASMLLGLGRVTFVDLFGMFFLSVLFSHSFFLSRGMGLEGPR